MPINWDDELQYLYTPRPTPKSGLLRRAVGDTAVDAFKGVVGMGQSAVGLADLATFGVAGDALNAIGYDPEATNKIADTYYSPQRQAIEQEIANAQGFTGKIGALASNPSAIVGRGVQSAPMLLGSMGVANRVYQGTKSLGAATAAGHVAEGAMTAGSVAQDIRNQGGDRGDMYWAVPAGAATAAIGYGAGKLMPDSQIESMLIPGARGASGASLPRRIGRAAFSEGVLEEMPQSGSEQAFTNLGTGKPVGYQVPEAMGEGLLVGGTTGGVLGGFRRNAPPAPVNLLGGANQNQGSAVANPAGVGAPALPPGAAPGAQGELFGAGEAPASPQFSAFPRMLANDPGAADTSQADLAELLDAQRRMMMLARDAEASGDAQRYYEAVDVLNQLAPVIDQLQRRVDRALAPLDTGAQGSLQLVDPDWASVRQPDMFGGPNVLYAPQAPESLLRRADLPLAPQEAPSVPAGQGDLFEQSPDALVRTEFGVPQIRAALRQANGGTMNAQLARFIPAFNRAIEEGPEAVDKLIASYDSAKSSLRPEVLETAAQMAQDYRSRLTNAQAAVGLERAQPGVTVGQQPVSGATEAQMRERNQQRGAQLTSALQRRAERLAVRDEQDTETLERMYADEAALADLESNIPERQPKVGPDGQMRLFSATEMGPLAPSAPTQEPAAATDQRRQRKMFDSKGRPVTQPKAKEKPNAVQEPSAAAVDARSGAGNGQAVGEGDAEGGQAPAPSEKPKRKAKVKAKVGDSEVELEIDNVDEKLASMKQDVDKYQRFIACLRKK